MGVVNTTPTSEDSVNTLQLSRVSEQEKKPSKGELATRHISKSICRNWSVFEINNKTTTGSSLCRQRVAKQLIQFTHGRAARMVPPPLLETVLLKAQPQKPATPQPISVRKRSVLLVRLLQAVDVSLHHRADVIYHDELNWRSPSR